MEKKEDRFRLDLVFTLGRISSNNNNNDNINNNNDHNDDNNNDDNNGNNNGGEQRPLTKYNSTCIGLPSANAFTTKMEMDMKSLLGEKNYSGENWQ